MRESIRLFRRDRRTALSAAIILAVGLGANIAIFAVAYGVLLRPLPLTDPDRVVVMWEHSARQASGVWEVSFRDFKDWQSQNTAFSGLAATGSINWPLRLIERDGPVPRTFAAVSGTFFEVLGAHAQLGRPLNDGDDSRASPRVAVISDAEWRSHFAASPTIVGTEVIVDDGAGRGPVTIVGVMPPDFDYPRGAALWMPLVPTLVRSSVGAGYDMLEARDLGILYVVGRVRPGVSLDRAKADLDVIVDRLTQHGASASGRSAVMTPLPDYLFGQAGRALRMLMAAGAVVLLLTCANAVALLLARLVRDRRSLFIRYALGAERSHLLRQALAEGVGVAAVALSAGLPVSWLMVSMFTRLAPESVPRINEVALGSPVVAAYAAGASVFVALVCGMAPFAVVLRRIREHRVAIGGTDARVATLPIRHGLVIGQTALAVVLLITAVLTVRSLRSVRHVPLGFEPADLVTFDVAPPPHKYANAVNQQFFRPALTAVQQLPGVASASAVYLRPFEYGAIGSGVAVVLEGEDSRVRDAWRKHPALNAEAVTPEYFGVMGIPVLRGRAFTDADGPHAPGVVVVSQSAATHLWPGQNPVGKRVLANYDRPDGTWQTVVGVVADARYRGLTEPSLDTLYKPYLQSTDPVPDFVVRPAGPPFAFVGGLRAALRAVDPGATVEAIRPLAAVVDREIAPWRFQSYVFTALAVIALIIALAGVYATLSQHVAEQTREIGIRVALGTERAHIVGLIGRRTGKLTAAAVVLGMGGAALWSRALSALLFGVNAADPVTYGAVAIIVGVTAVAGAWLPAHRATLIDPSEALRQEP
jgi:predicted permease